MRGFAVPDSLVTTCDWKRLADNASTAATIAHDGWVQELMFGHDVAEAMRVRVHVLVPTQFGVILDAERDRINAHYIEHAVTTYKCDVVERHRPHSNKKKRRAVVTPVKNGAMRAALQHQALLCNHCIVCGLPLPRSETHPYQLVLRVVGGTKRQQQQPQQPPAPAAVNVWHYDVLYSYACRKCQTVPSKSLIRTTECRYDALASCISDFGFSRTLPMSQFMRAAPAIESVDDDEDADEQDDEDDDADNNSRAYQQRMHEALVRSYMHRFAALNMHAADIVRAMRVDPATQHPQCYHCAEILARQDDVYWCTGCAAVAACWRCALLMRIEHAAACVNVCEKKLFHTARAWYVEQTDQTYRRIRATLIY